MIARKPERARALMHELCIRAAHRNSISISSTGITRVHIRAPYDHRQREKESYRAEFRVYVNRGKAARGIYTKFISGSNIALWSDCWREIGKCVALEREKREAVVL